MGSCFNGQCRHRSGLALDLHRQTPGSSGPKAFDVPGCIGVWAQSSFTTLAPPPAYFKGTFSPHDPQLWHNRDLGKSQGRITISPPRQCSLYPSCRRNSAGASSEFFRPQRLCQPLMERAFHLDNGDLGRQLVGQLMREVLSDVSHLAMSLCHGEVGLGSVPRPRLTTGHLSLRTTQRFHGTPERLRARTLR